MSRLARTSSLIVALVLLPALLPAQENAKLPPVRPLGAVTHKSPELLGAVSAARQLPNGRVIVNDNAGRKVVMFDSTLATFTVVADTTSATANAYSSRAGGLIAYHGDSTLFVDPTSLSMLVIDGTGRIGRVMSVPRPNEAMMLIGGPNGTPGFDGQGRLVYRAMPNFRMAPPPAGSNGAAPMLPDFPDSAAVVRVDLATRKVDTVAFMKIPKQRLTMTQDANGRMMVNATINPMPLTDDWAVLSDGRVAMLRGSDYHVDWISADGSKASSGKIPFAWRRLSDEDKVAYIDSTKAAMEKLREQAMANRGRDGGPMIVNPSGGGGGPPAGAEVMVFRMGAERAAAADGGGRGRPGGDGGGAPAAFTMPPLNFISPSELPDYAPPFGSGAARGDLDGNLWIRTSYGVNGGPVYDIVNGQGQLIDRVQIPAGRVISGFGPGGVVFMGVREGTGVRLEMARVR